MQIRVCLLSFKMLISSVLGVIFLILGFLMTILEPTNIHNILMNSFSIFAFVISALFFLISFLLFLNKLIILIDYFLLYKFGKSYTAEVDVIYSESCIQNIGKGRFYLTCKLWTLDDGLLLLESDLDRTGYLRKVSPKTVKVYMSTRDKHRYFVDLPIKI